MGVNKHESRPVTDGARNSAGGRVSQFQTTGLLASCVEVDLRPPRDDPGRYVRHALDGIAAGDVVKLLVDRHSNPTVLASIDLRGVRFQVTADSVWTRRQWDVVVAAVIG